MLIAFLAILALAGLIYMLPTIIAVHRGHPNMWLVGAINVMTGLTVLGWFFALREALKPLPQATAVQALEPAQHALQSRPPALARPTQAHTSQQHHRRTRMGFFAAIGSCLRKYSSISGRALRSEMWYFFLFIIIALIASSFADEFFHTPVWGPGSDLGLITALVALFLQFPWWAVQTRRLHDTDHSGWTILLVLVPIVGWIMLLLWFCRKGTAGDNRFGPDPLLIMTNRASHAMSPIVTVSEKAEQLAKIKGLLESGTITQEEFDRMKAEVLAS